MHVRAWHDDRQRSVSVLAIHNSDVADGWERESESEDYFKTFSEKIAYPLGVNIIFYLMTRSMSSPTPPPVLVPDAFEAERAAVEQLIAGRTRMERGAG